MDRERTLRDFLVEAAQALAIVAGIVLAGLGARELSSAEPGAAYAGAVEQDPDIALWLVDGFNVLQVAMLRGRERSEWWGPERRAELLARVARFQPASEAELMVAFDGERAAEAAQPPGPGVVFAPSADEWIVARLRQAGDASRVAVVTADRRLASRARQRGARIVAPHAFLARCG